ncbi:hypothetical protein Q7P37_005876 [Cladosporium fusiforme]
MEANPSLEMWYVEVPHKKAQGYTEDSSKWRMQDLRQTLHSSSILHACDAFLPAKLLPTAANSHYCRTPSPGLEVELEHLQIAARRHALRLAPSLATRDPWTVTYPAVPSSPSPSSRRGPLHDFDPRALNVALVPPSLSSHRSALPKTPLAPPKHHIRDKPSHRHYQEYSPPDPHVLIFD